MAIDVTILKDEDNSLVGRRQLLILLKHESKGTPSRHEARNVIASKLKVPLENLYTRSLLTKTGATVTVCEAEIYQQPDSARKVLPEFLFKRGLPKEQGKEREVASSGKQKKVDVAKKDQKTKDRA